MKPGELQNEILKAERAWVDLERRVISLPDSKTGRKLLFLSEPAMTVIRHLWAASPNSRYLIPGRRGSNVEAGDPGDRPLDNLTKPWRLVKSRAELDDFRLHDLRHTAASIAVAAGASLPVIGRLLGHSQAQTTNRYAHVDVDPALSVANIVGAAVADALSVGSTATRPTSK